MGWGTVPSGTHFALLIGHTNCIIANKVLKTLRTSKLDTLGVSASSFYPTFILRSPPSPKTKGVWTPPPAAHIGDFRQDEGIFLRGNANEGEIAGETRPQK